MASLVQHSLGSCLSLNKAYSTMSVVQSCNASYLSKPFPMPKFFPLSSGGNQLLRSVPEEREENKWRACCYDDGSCGIAPSPLPPSASDLAMNFYNFINAKNTERLDQLLAPECVFQDLVFYIPFAGKESVMNFLSNLMDAMGPNVHFHMDSIAQSENYTVTAIWHLEWKQKEIPFTTGCSFFDCVETDGKLLIRKITGVEEFPVKPGDLVLKLLKATSTVFDRFPLAAEGLLLKSHSTHEGILMLLDMLGGYRKK